MREPMSLTERRFILAALAERKRTDGRDTMEYRSMIIEFGVERGCCYVHLGQTKVMAQVSCALAVPKDSRPTDGVLVSSVEFSPLAGAQFEAGGAPSTEVVETSRLLERCLRGSRCVDTESLCISAGVKVWCVRVDVRVLAHRGNVIDAASVAAIAALLHFRRPDVTVCGTDVTVHDSAERDPIPLSVHHVPVCMTTAFYEGARYMLVDPSDREERIMDGRMVIAMNKHREICLLQVTGGMLLLREQVTRCTSMAVGRVSAVTELIHSALERDAVARRFHGVPPELSLCTVSPFSDLVQCDTQPSKSAGCGLNRAELVGHLAQGSYQLQAEAQDVVIGSSSSSDVEMVYEKQRGEVNAWMRGDTRGNEEGDKGHPSDIFNIDSSDLEAEHLNTDVKTMKVDLTRPTHKKIGSGRITFDHFDQNAAEVKKAKRQSTTGSSSKSGHFDITSNAATKKKPVRQGKKSAVTSVIELSDSSAEEENVVLVKASDFGFKSS